jgi:hypothetical protein
MIPEMPILAMPVQESAAHSISARVAVTGAVSVCAGCTMTSLERHTVAQIDTTTDLRYQEIVNNLAMIAADPSTLPTYSSIFSGTIFVQDTGQVISTTTWPFAAKLGADATNPSLNRQASQNWTLDPVMVPEKLEAMRAACQWAIGGRASVHPDSLSLLDRPEQWPRGPNRHFGVSDKLNELPVGWLDIGAASDVPKHARYKSHCGNTWVWVTSDGMNGLADFTLIIQNIARIQINSPTLFNPLPVYTPITFLTTDLDPADRVKVTAQVVVDQGGRLQTDLPYVPIRVETTGVDSNIRSAISAAGISSVPH